MKDMICDETGNEKHCTCSSKLNIALRVVAVQLTPLTMESSPTSLMDHEYITNTMICMILLRFNK